MMKFKKGQKQTQTKEQLSANGKNSIEKQKEDPAFFDRCSIRGKKLAAAKKTHPEWEVMRIAALKKSEKAKIAWAKTMENHSEHVKKAVIAMSIDPRFMSCPENQNARIWRVKSPRGISYEVKNLSYFIQTHRELFADDDFNPENPTKSRAYGGIVSITPYNGKGEPKPRVNGVWKGWTWASSID